MTPGLRIPSRGGRWTLRSLLINCTPRPLKKVRDLDSYGTNSSTTSETQSAFPESALADSVAVSSPTPTALPSGLPHPLHHAVRVEDLRF
jgi:hypothetical protein